MWHIPWFLPFQVVATVLAVWATRRAQPRIGLTCLNLMFLAVFQIVAFDLFFNRRPYNLAEDIVAMLVRTLPFLALSLAAPAAAARWRFHPLTAGWATFFLAMLIGGSLS